VDAPWTLRAARSWGTWAGRRERWHEAAEAYTFGTAAADRLFQVQLVREHSETILRLTATLHANAAYALDKSGNSPAAAVAVERGRAVLLSEALERDRADLQRLLETGHRDLADRYRRAALRLSILMRPAATRLS
jgi:hypothetical protein